MKPILILIALCLYGVSSGQITFQEITAPKDFSMDAIRKSPTGEFFVQGINFNDIIYTSLDGNTWAANFLPVPVTIMELQFFADGTPVLNSAGTENQVRRNGTWHTMQAMPNESITASFVKDDTLFTFHANTFFFSLDTGKTFITAFEYDEPVNPFQYNMWKFDHHYVLHYSFDGEYFLSVFDQLGSRVLHQELALSQPGTLYNTCGEVIIYDHINYYRINGSLDLTHGSLTEILPPSVFNNELGSSNGYYYAHQEDVLYLSPGCDMHWEVAATHDAIRRHQYRWVGPAGEIYLYNALSDHYILGDFAQNTWEPQPVSIDWPYFTAVDESRTYQQLIVSPNDLFSKHRDALSWIDLDSAGSIYTTIHYSPDGDLYVRTENNLLHSKDNGTTFSVIQPPATQPPFWLSVNLFVPDNDVLFYFDDFFGESYYSVDNGAHWNIAVLPFHGYAPRVKRVQNDIVIAGGDGAFAVSYINLITQEVTSVFDTEYVNAFFTDVAILDDGTVYASLIEFLSNENLLLRYHKATGFEVASTDPVLGDLFRLFASGNNLYGFDFDKYFLLSGSTLKTYSYEGLPTQGFKQFFLGESEHVFVMIDGRRIFRSVEPLSFSKFLTGRLYFDHGHDCLADTLERGLVNWVVIAENSRHMQAKSTDSEGKFNFDLPDGTYTVSVRPPSHHWDICTPSYPFTVDSNHAAVSQDFQAFAVSQCANLELDFSTPLLRRCFENTYTVRVRNTGPQASLGTTVRIQLDPYFEFISATIPPIAVDNHVYTFDVGELDLNEEVTFRILFLLSCDAEPGSEHCMKGSLQDDNLCGERSQYEECQVNIGSYDPNDKRVFNEAGKETGRVDKGEYLYYHIRFQNTGTDTAFTVRINDPLSPNLDYSTLEMLSASHPYTWLLNDGPALSILFENILLPDSNVNEPASHGYVKFRIKPLPEFDYGTTIPNTAGIYFDFNDPVLTNTVSTVILPTVKTIDPVDPIAFAISPNPSNALIHIAISPADLVKADVCEVIDLFGRRLISSVTLTPEQVIDISGLTPGMYTVVLRKHGVAVGAKKFARL